MSGSPHSHPLPSVISSLFRFPFGRSRLLSLKTLGSRPQTHQPQGIPFCTLQNWVCLLGKGSLGWEKEAPEGKHSYGCKMGIFGGTAKSSKEAKPLKKYPPKTQPFPFYFLTPTAGLWGLFHLFSDLPWAAWSRFCRPHPVLIVPIAAQETLTQGKAIWMAWMGLKGVNEARNKLGRGGGRGGG